jgi:hypothetical protein
MMIGLRARASSAATADLVGVGDRAADHPVALGEELDGVVEGVALDVLGQREHHRTGVDGVGEHAHGVGQRGEQLLGPGDPVEEPRDGPEGVVDGGVGLGRVLQLLQHRALPAGGVGVAGEQQHGEPVHRRQRGPGDHVRGAWADRGGHRERGGAAARLGVRGRDVHERLLVAALDEGQLVLVLVERLPDARDVAVPEDAEHRGDQALPAAVAHARLRCQVAHDGLGGGQRDGVVAVRGHGRVRGGGLDHVSPRGAVVGCAPYGPWTVWSKSMTDPVTSRDASLSR